jgi:hypothetical protein
VAVRTIASTLAALLALSGPVPARARADAAQAQAAGAPIVPSCGAMQATVNKLKSGLPLQDEWIKRSEAQLRAAEDGVRGAQEELQSMALKAAVDLVDRQLEIVRELKSGIAKAAASNATRQKWLDRVDMIKKAAEKVEDAEKLGKAGVEGNQLGAAIAQNRGRHRLV